MNPSSPGELARWFRVARDTKGVHLDVAPPGRQAWEASFDWADVVRVCFKAEGGLASDGIYVFTKTRPESFAIPVEASGGAELWDEIVHRGLFDAELAIKAATAPRGLFCWPAGDEK